MQCWIFLPLQSSDALIFFVMFSDWNSRPCDTIWTLFLLQRIGMGQSFPWLIDSVLCVGVILHGICNQKPESNAIQFSFPGIGRNVVRMYYVYLLAGYYCFHSGLALAPYKIFYPLAAMGFLSFLLSVWQKRSREKGEAHVVKRKHSHRHWWARLIPQLTRFLACFGLLMLVQELIMARRCVPNEMGKRFCTGGGRRTCALIFRVNLEENLFF